MDISKTRFLQGLQCHKQLWWRVHEPDAPELEVDKLEEAIFDQGRRVGEEARKAIPGGVLISPPDDTPRGRIRATDEAMAGGAPLLYEPTFVANGVHAAVDILQKRSDGYAIIEVKAKTKVDDVHIDDVAIQAHILKESGHKIEAVELMHLDPKIRSDDPAKLFVSQDVTSRVEERLAGIPGQLESVRNALSGELPEVPTGDHCKKPYECPFIERCWEPLRANSLEVLYRLSSKKLSALRELRVKTIDEIPEDFSLSATNARQRRAARAGKVVVEPGLGAKLDAIPRPLAYLDFETVAPAIPQWRGCGPYTQVPAQFSLHLEDQNENVTHSEWLAAGGKDPRSGLAEALVQACDGAQAVAVYYVAFERKCIKQLAEAVPDLAIPLAEIESKLVDLLPIVRDHVYHPNFKGSFSLKSVLPALDPEFSYADLEIKEGQSASLKLLRLILEPDTFSDAEKQQVRRNLLLYCKMDTEALVVLKRQLYELAAAG